MENGLFQYAVMPLLIFLARVCDVSLGTLRIIFVSRGRKLIAPFLGFVEVLIWLLVITQILRGMNNLVAFLAYAAGFAMGNFVGMLIEERLAIGVSAVRVIGSRRMGTIAGELQKKGFGVTTMDGRGARGPVTILFTMVKRKEIGSVLKIILRHDPKAFYSVEDARTAGEGIFRGKRLPVSKKIRFFFRFLKPGK